MKPAIVLFLALAAAVPAWAAPGGSAGLPGDAGPSALRAVLGSGLAAFASPDSLLDDPDGEKARTGDELVGMFETRDKEIEQGIYELRLSCWLWSAALDARMKASTRDTRLAQALCNLEEFQSSIHHIDLVEEMNVDETRLIVAPEITLRFNNSALRASWWWFRETTSVTPGKVYTFGDVIYAVDTDGEANPNRIPPDAAPASPVLPKIAFTAELMDTKLLYEARIKASASLEAYVGLGIHWLRYKGTARTTDRVFTAYSDGAIHDREPVTKEEIGDYPLISFSLRVEYRPYANFYFSLDAQEMYLYFGNYTDLKIAVWNQIMPYVRIGAGWRLWNVQANLYELGGSKSSIEVNAVLSGFWGGLFILI
jgi:hypothetical protein